MSLEVPDTEDHPNKAPFAGILTFLDVASDHPPGGSGGKLVIMTSASARKALPTLLGMAVDLTDMLDGHDTKNKIGIISEAVIENGAIAIKGFFYEADFPEEVRQIKASKSRLGWSYEIQRVIVEDANADPLVITDFVFTGAAILRKDKAAYSETSLSANAEGDDMTPEELKALMDAVKGIKTGLEAVTKEVTDLKAKAAAGGAIQGEGAGTGMHALVKPFADKLRKVGGEMHAAGIGTHAAEGHVAVLNRMADHMEASAIMGKMPHIYRDHDYWMNAAEQQRARELAAAGGADNPAIKAVEKNVGDLTKQVTDLAGVVSTAVSDMKTKIDAIGAAGTGAGGAQRKTVPAHVAALLSKTGLTVEAAGAMDVHKLDEAFEKAGIKRQDGMKIKLALHHTGSLQ